MVGEKTLTNAFHVLLGLLSAYLMTYNYLITMAITVTYMVYQLLDDFDSLYEDSFEYLYGMFLGSLFILIYKVLEILFVG